MTKEALIRLLHTRKARRGTWAALAEELGVTPQHLQDIKDGRREPGEKILSGLGMERIVSYHKKDEVTK